MYYIIKSVEISTAINLMSNKLSLVSLLEPDLPHGGIIE
jgi:hypothetical protein